MYEATVDDLADLKISLGIAADDTSQDPLLNLLLVRAGTAALNEINAAYLPAGLQPLIVDLAADAYRLNKGEAVGSISSIEDNGQKVSYDQSVTKAVAASLKDRRSQFDQYRNPGW